MRSTVLSRPYRIGFVIDAVLAVGAGLYWIAASGAFVQSVFGVAEPDGVHRMLAQKGGLFLLFAHGVYGLTLALRRELPLDAFRTFHALLLFTDLGMLAIGAEMLAAASRPQPRAAALSQIVVAILRVGLRGSFLRSSQALP